MSICNAYNRRLKVQCTRGKSHVGNGLAHADNNGNTWPVHERTENYDHLRPSAEFKARIHKAVKRRMERSRHDLDDQAKHALLISLLEAALTAALDTVNEFRRLDGQSVLQIDTPRGNVFEIIRK